MLVLKQNYVHQWCFVQYSLVLWVREFKVTWKDRWDNLFFWYWRFMKNYDSTCYVATKDKILFMKRMWLLECVRHLHVIIHFVLFTVSNTFCYKYEMQENYWYCFIIFNRFSANAQMDHIGLWTKPWSSLYVLIRKILHIDYYLILWSY